MAIARDRIGLAIAGGPNGGTTPILLDTLAALDQRCSFFLEADRVGRNPHITYRVAQDGHDAGLLGPGADLEVSDCRSFVSGAVQNIESITGNPVLAYMDRDNAELSAGANAARAVGLPLARWHYRIPEWTHGFPDVAAEQALDHLTGGNVLLIDGTEVPNGPRIDFERAQLLEALVGRLRGAGFDIVPLSGL
jgi:peptidoglycan/xylan/chitin deacetylase (PgdA/CDA1 family)